MAPIKDKFSIHTKAVVCQDVDLRGDITIGSGTIVHPKVTIFAITGPIVIGSGNIIEEGAIIINRCTIQVLRLRILAEQCAHSHILSSFTGALTRGRKKETMRIGDDNLFEIGSRVESPAVGSFNTIGTRARVHYTIRMTSNCTLGPGVLLVTAEEETLPDYTVVYGPDAERRIWSGRGQIQEMDLRRKHAEYLRETIPKFNRLRKGEETV